MTDEPVNPLEVRVTRLEGLCEQIDRQLGSLETLFDSGFADLRADIRASRSARSDTGAKLDKLGSKIDGLGTKIDRLETRIDSRFNIITFLYLFITAVQLVTALGLFNRVTPQT